MIQHICSACGTYEEWHETAKRYEMRREAENGVLACQEVTYAACPRCGLVGKFPMPHEEELRRYYGEAWQYESARPGYDKAAAFLLGGMIDYDGAGKFPLMAGPGMGQASMIGDGTVLDVGSKGNRMVEALQALGLNVKSAGGLDAQPKDATVRQAWLGSGETAVEEHSIVCAAHVLEHVLNPAFFLADLAALTAVRGYIYIEVPSLRGGLRDVGYCDDLNRNHLWHFGLEALMRLGSQVGTVMRLETDISLPGWPVDRMVIRRELTHIANRIALNIISSDIRSEYDKAAAFIEREGTSVGLYGASHSYAQLLQVRPSLKRWRVFDQYKAGLTYQMPEHPHSVKIEDPEQMGELPSRKVLVTTRSWNSYVDIRNALALKYPGILVATPYANIEQALA